MYAQQHDSCPCYFGCATAKNRAVWALWVLVFGAGIGCLIAGLVCMEICFGKYEKECTTQNGVYSNDMNYRTSNATVIYTSCADYLNANKCPLDAYARTYTAGYWLMIGSAIILVYFCCCAERPAEYNNMIYPDNSESQPNGPVIIVAYTTGPGGPGGPPQQQVQMAQGIPVTGYPVAPGGYPQYPYYPGGYPAQQPGDGPGGGPSPYPPGQYYYAPPPPPGGPQPGAPWPPAPPPPPPGQARPVAEGGALPAEATAASVFPPLPPGGSSQADGQQRSVQDGAPGGRLGSKPPDGRAD
ncbi:hypothetical protein HYH03_009784 [Edaphochlamys debaryana]|uniref:Uncharacterized protein n=1 Tax=Edaphochlamys debaryana TaxID=47281 RepID=A0A835XY90_9CHLO|nr:hypothetical protein HYH03_009784 [Edaphochlamys debaryana]|eukprot:KAG2491827.1 hypothetical protein HYH03_009784 [Edaphochlamys debaryana]